VLGFNGALRSGGFTVGALLGGALVGELSWRWAFLINVPVAILILAITPFVVRKSRATEEVRLRWSPSISFRNHLLSGGT
jgi:MFS family permease